MNRRALPFGLSYSCHHLAVVLMFAVAGCSSVNEGHKDEKKDK